MSTAVLLCGDSGVAAAGVAAAPASGVAIVDGLCDRPEAAAAALRRLKADRVVLGLCDRRPSGELLAALRRAGVAPFATEAVTLRSRGPRETAAVLAGALAKLMALAPGERGRPTAATGEVSRRALFSPASVVSHAPVAVLDESACAGTAACGLCLDSCPENMIATGAPHPVIDPTACTACGLCVPRCPPGALHLAGSGTAQTEAQIDALLQGGLSRILIGCASADPIAPPGWGLVELPTLALVTPGWILQLRTRGAEVRLMPCGGECCAEVGEVEELADRLSEPTGSGDPLRGPPRLSEPEATVQALAALEPRAGAPAIEAGASPLGLVSLDVSRCTVCSACATACPTGALVMRESESGLQLEHDPTRCVGCDRCVSVCPEDAIKVTAGIDPGRLRAGAVALIAALHERCAVCGTQLAPLPMRRRVAELLGRPDAPPDLCAMCAARARPALAPAVWR